MNKVVATATIIAVIVLSACNTKPSLVGKWKGQIEENGQKVDSKIEFQNGGKMVAQISMSGLEAEVSSTYTSTETAYTSTVEGFKIIKLPPELESSRSMIETGMASQKGKSITNSYVFKDGDTIEVSFEGGFTSTWKRVK